jgi:glycosyltransferase involved in cell wall biosynthesis
MKILIATGIYPPTVGGPATYSKLLHDELPKIGIKVKIVSFDSFSKFPKFISHSLYFLKLFFSGLNVNLIYAMDPVTVGFPAMIVARLLGKKIVLKIVGDRAWEQGVQEFGIDLLLDDFITLRQSQSKEKEEELPTRIEWIQRIQETVAGIADKIIVPSEYLKKIVTKWGIDENKIVVIYNSFEGVPVYHSEFISESQEILKQVQDDNIGIQDDKKDEIKTILSAGRLVPWKGFETLILIMPELLKEFPNLKLEIAGNGPEREKLEKIISENNLNENVKLLGSLSKEDLASKIKSSDVFVLNTAYEGFSHQILEVLSLGTPLVTTNVGGNPEIIVNEGNGLLVEYDDKKALIRAVKRVLSDNELSQKISENGKETIKNYSKEKMLEQLTSELKNVL